MEIKVLIAGDESLAESFNGEKYEEFSKTLDKQFKHNLGDKVFVSIKRDKSLKEFNAVVKRYAAERNFSILEFLPVKDFDERPTTLARLDTFIANEVNRAIVFKREYGSPTVRSLISAFERNKTRIIVINA